MGDKSPKSKQRNQKQKQLAKQHNAESAKAKQERLARPVPPATKDEK